MAIEKTCEVCGGVFLVKPYRANTARFCSFSCSGTWHHSQRPDIGFRFPKGNTIKPINRRGQFTSERMRGEQNPKWVASIPLTCANCGIVFEQKPWLVRQNQSKSGYKFCGGECKNQFLKGDKHPRYVGGPQTYRGRSWLKARMKAVRRDNGTCQQCGVVIGDSIPVHHIKPFREFENEHEANCLENLVCMCQSCHMKNEPR